MSGYKVAVAPTSDGGKRPRSISPRQALQRWLDTLRVEKAPSTVSDYHYRLKHFVEWCEKNGIERVNELDGWELDAFATHRRGEGLAPITLSKELGTVRSLLQYCERIEVLEEGTAEKLDVPTVNRQEQVDDSRLEPSVAEQLLEAYRQDPELQYTRAHALLAVAWATGARLGALRALDLRDRLPEDQAVAFRHRPGRDTPLKNSRDGERIVGLPDSAWHAMQGYIEHHRNDVHDDNDGSRPLFASRGGRGSRNAIRCWMYLATVPCIYRDCPHGKQRPGCEYLDYTNASKCPSSRSPHQVRTGSITWQLNQGIPKDVVAERVNTSVDVLDQHYDVSGRLETMRERRAQYVDQLGFEEDENQ